MRFIEILIEFYDNLCCKAANSEKPEKILLKGKIVEIFLLYVDELNDVNDNSEKYRMRYKEENTYCNFVDFIYTKIMMMDKERDVAKEYLRLKEQKEMYENLLQSKKEKYERELKNKRDNNYSKNKYFKTEVEKKIKKLQDQDDTKSLVRMALNNCSLINNMGLIIDEFKMDIYSLQKLDVDKRYYIYFGELPVTTFEQIMQLKKRDHSAYLGAFREVISSLEVVEKIIKMTKENYYLYDRMELLCTALDLFCSENYRSFVYLIVPQIEGIFRSYLKLLGDNSSVSGINDIAKKIKNNGDFLEFVYFAYDFVLLRNKIAHGYIIEVNCELAYEVIMDLFWLVKEIDSDNRNYKIWFSFLQRCSECENLSMTFDYILNFFTGLEGEMHIKLLDMHLKDEFKEEIAWYKFDDQVKQFNTLLRSELFYKLIWDERSLEICGESIEIDGKQLSVIKYNNKGLRYQDLIEKLHKYSFVSEEWYMRYTAYCGEVEKLQEQRYREKGILIDEMDDKQ